MALTAIPTDQRLVEGPIAVDVHLRQPDLGAFARWYQGCRSSPEPYKARSACMAPLRNSTSRRICTCKNSASRAPRSRSRAPSVIGHMADAPSIQDLQHAIQRGDLTLTADTLAMRIPLLQGQLSAQEGPAQPFEVRDFVLQADGRWSPNGMAATLRRCACRQKRSDYPARSSSSRRV